MIIEYDPSQLAAIKLAIAEPISIITGGPGTGKSTILAEALRRYAGNGERVALAAPTGKAAKRMQEATGRPAQTIHRLLKWNPIEGGFYHGEGVPLDVDVVVIDEASMVDVALFACLLEAIAPTRTRLVLVGDANQLPSVGPGAILADLVRSDLVPCARLTQVHRSKAESWICTNAPRVLAGESIEIDNSRGDFEYVECDAAGNVPKFCGDAFAELGAQVLVPQKTGKAGAEAINTAMQARFNPLRPGEVAWGKAPNQLRPRDRVIHVKNDYDLGVFNGECGEIVSIDSDAGAMLVQYPDRNGPVLYNKAAAWNLRLSYALTIHKSQGSEWPWVIVVVHNTHSYMLTRQLLYTAITRGKEGVVIVGNPAGVANALKSKRDSSRNTALCDRIRGEL